MMILVMRRAAQKTREAFYRQINLPRATVGNRVRICHADGKGILPGAIESACALDHSKTAKHADSFPRASLYSMRALGHNTC